MKIYRIYVVTLLFVNSCVASDNMVALKATEHQKEVDKKAAAASQAVATIPERHMRDRIQETIAYKAQEFRKKTSENAVAFDAVDKVTSTIYEYYFLHPESASEYFYGRPQERDRAYKAAAHFDEETNAYRITRGISWGQNCNALTLLLDGPYGEQYEQYPFDFVSVFGHCASDYATGYVGKETEREILMDTSIIEKALPRVIMAAQAMDVLLAQTHDSEDRADFLTRALVSSAIHYLHPKLLETLLSLGARASNGTMYPLPKTLTCSFGYADAVLPKGHPFTHTARSLLWRHARQELIQKGYTQEMMTRAELLSNSVAGMKRYLEKNCPHINSLKF